VIPESASGEMLSFNVSSLIFNQATVIFSKGSRPDGCEKALSLYATGSLKVAIGHVFRLERTADTHRVVRIASTILAECCSMLADQGFVPTPDRCGR